MSFIPQPLADAKSAFLAANGYPPPPPPAPPPASPGPATSAVKDGAATRAAAAASGGEAASGIGPPSAQGAKNASTAKRTLGGEE